jgi:hypothetical protein
MQYLYYHFGDMKGKLSSKDIVDSGWSFHNLVPLYNSETKDFMGCIVSFRGGLKTDDIMLTYLLKKYGDYRVVFNNFSGEKVCIENLQYIENNINFTAYAGNRLMANVLFLKEEYKGIFKLS